MCEITQTMNANRFPPNQDHVLQVRSSELIKLSKFA